ncbi:3-oxoacyl-[acyl-carrier-protein] synthase 3 [Actinoplanes philippinensis]|uniref:Beta-ketoacyl-[acyl-carrier-protein] synthase III n=1 Tax=Actinoplanes philippinensis TaxID=35752 RepID=A0A1I2EL88_9ACTN|nr:beta-ketoacyl-ACP synthase 3 [Actinoplanes philippinensis]GIE82598.1 3-oxoacyl-[acyl-carrier-protein] synthase 3 [Actinoplanes philippinensis]SFE93483.1 3-oxoacyl-[acyl-carrier-protein] synthase-3 [Actinoplanes philippinensis]
MSVHRGSAILGVGAYRPARIVGNDEVSGMIDSSDEWIRRRSGIVTRRFAGPEETVVTMAAEAVRKAAAQAGTDPRDLDVVLLATMSLLRQSPPGAPQVAELIGARPAAGMDLNAACSGFSYALAVADGLVRAGARRVAVIGSERMSDLIDSTDRSTAFLFGDGAGAVVVGAADTPGIGPVVWGSDGSRHHLIAHDHAWGAGDTHPYMRMAGPEVFRWATEAVPDISRRALAAARTEPHELAAFIPHQANLRIVEAAARSLALPAHTAVARDVVHSGNTSAASIPLAMEALLARGEAGSGGRALLAGFGAGLTYAAQVVTLP